VGRTRSPGGDSLTGFRGQSTPNCVIALCGDGKFPSATKTGCGEMMIAAYEKRGPGLKPLVFARFFAGLKPCAPSQKKTSAIPPQTLALSEEAG
jgi:hypothetical protein